LVRLQNCRAFTTASEEGGDGFNGMAEENFEPSLSTDPPLAPTPVLPTGLWASIAKGKGPGTVTGRAASSATPRQSAHAAAATGTANGGGRDPTPDILKMCGHALRAAGMAWSRNALVTAGFQNIESSRIIDLCTSFSEGNGIVRWFEAMQALGCEPTEVSSIGSTSNRTHICRSQFEPMCICHVNPVVHPLFAIEQVTFTSAIKAYGYKKNTRTASAWLAAMQLVGIEPSQKAYCSIINAHVRAKDLSGAELWFQRLRSAGLEPDQVAFNIMMSAYTR
jgi:pentatricopeptide repeat protein